MSEVLIHKTKDNKVCRLELNLPEKRNILSLDMIQSLIRSLETLSEDPDIHLLILSGRGLHFCAGGDLRWMRLDSNSSDLENINQVRLLAKVFYSLHNFPYPVIGKIQGSVFGGGLGLLSLCDIAIAHEESSFCFSELKLALIPSVISPFVLNKAPLSLVKELMLTARIFNVETAKRMNLIHFSGNNKDCESHMKGLIDQLLRYDKMALKQTKKLLNTVLGLSELEAKDYTIQALAERRKSPEVFKQISQFLKRKEKKEGKTL